MSYSREEVKAITDKVLNMAKADAVEVRFSGGERSATRYANSTITANLVEHDQEVLITVYYGQKSATTSTHQFDDASLKSAIEQAQELAKRRPDNPELMPLVKPPQDYLPIDGALPAAVAFGPAERARMVKQSVDVCEKKGVLGSGYIPKLHWTDALANSEGLFAYYRYAEASFILTCRTPDGTGSGWAGTTGLKDISKIDAAALTEIAADKAMKSRKPRALEPGNYTVILEPRPAARFLSLMLFALNARAAEEGRSFMSGKERGATKLGQKIFGDNVTIRSDVGNTVLRQTPIGPDGLAARPITWVEKGVVKNLFYDRYWAKKQNKAVHADEPEPEPGDGRRRRDGRADDQVDQARPAGELLLVHPAGRSDDAAQHRHDARRPVPDRERRDRRPGAELPLERRPGARLQQHLDARPRRCRCTSGEAYDNPGTALVPAMKIEDFRMTSISPAV